MLLMYVHVHVQPAIVLECMCTYLPHSQTLQGIKSFLVQGLVIMLLKTYHV